MKRMVLVLIIAALVVGGAFAQMSAGVGLKGSFNTYKMEMGPISVEQKINAFGANLFLDIRLAEINVDYLVASPDDDSKVQTSFLTLGVVGKYPIALGGNLEVFPFVGIDYAIAVAQQKDGKDTENKDLADQNNRLSILFGVGFDFGFTDSLFLRAEIGYGIGLNSKKEQEAVDKSSNVKISYGQVPFKVAIGFKL